MKTWFLPLILLAGCASQPPPPVAFLYKGMSRHVMLEIMGKPIQAVTTYQNDDPQGEEAKKYQFSNAKCIGGTKVVCTVSVTKEGTVYGWEGIQPMYTEDGQK